MATRIAPRPYEPDVAIPPAATLRELLDVNGMTQQDLAERLGRPANKVNEILQGKRAITVETAMGLELVLGRSADFWLQLERNYQLAKVRIAANAAFAKQATMLKQFPIKQMVQLGWLRKMATPAAQVRELLAYFGVASFDQLSKPAIFAPAFRKAKTEESCPYALAAWLRRGTQMSAQINTAPYSARGLKGALVELRAMTTRPPEEFEERLVSLCASHGVAVVFVPHLPKSDICGAAYWVGDKAVVQLSLRFNTDDQFWLSFFHELGHILKHSKREAFLDNFKMDDGDKEQVANAFATRLLIQDALYRRLVQLNYEDADVIREFAVDIGVSPGIVVGRLQDAGILAKNRLNDLKAEFAMRNA
jgi:HTH-type transcriptional regulator / antitoxin HigA